MYIYFYSGLFIYLFIASSLFFAHLFTGLFYFLPIWKHRNVYIKTKPTKTIENLMKVQMYAFHKGH